ncbi:MAG TPA: glycosyltransferase [Candidatus Dormibacteraeota bacterium]
MARIVFTTIGSLGDLFPMMPVAQKLKARGQDVVFVVPQHLAGAVQVQGFDCRVVVLPRFGGSRSQEESTARADVQARIRERFPVLARETMRVLEPACEGADVLVTSPNQLVATMVAVKLGLIWVTLTVFPGNIPSAYTVPQPHWLPALRTPIGRMVNRATWRVFQFGINYLDGDAITKAVEDAGLSAHRDLFATGGLSPHLTLLLSSPLYSPHQPDWPRQIKVAGFAIWDEPQEWREPPQLAEFLAAGDPPVVVTTSSAGERDAVSFFRSAADALTSVGKRGILLLGNAATEIGAAPGELIAPGVIAWPYLPLSRVVPAASLVVHHAGIGTTLTTIRFGKPCLAIPAIFDQWYNAGRIKSLGVGRVLEWKRFTTDRLAADIDRVARSPQYEARARAIGHAIALEDGATAACDQIEALLEMPAAS